MEVTVTEEQTRSARDRFSVQLALSGGSFPVRSATMTVDYDYVAIAGRDYLLPVRSTVSVQKGHKKIELNEIAFRNYRRFASRTKIKMAQ